MDELDFSHLSRTEIPVKIKERNFLIIDPSTGAKNRYRNLLLKSAKADENGKIKFFENLADTEIYLISICMVEIDDKGKEVSLDNSKGREFLNSLDYRITSKLYKVCKDIGDKEEPNAQKQEEKKEEEKGTETENKESGDDEAKKN